MDTVSNFKTCTRATDFFFKYIEMDNEHDLRSALHSILALLSILEESSLTDEHRQLVNTINDSTRQLAELIVDHPQLAESFPSSPQNAVEGFRILTADDDRVNRAVTYRLLEHMGCKVTAVEAGKECLEALATGANAYDVVLLDLRMREVQRMRSFSVIRHPRGISKCFHTKFEPILSRTLKWRIR
jgi:PleD family two-component response regulator